MTTSKKQRLLDLGAERLADALLRLAERNEDADDLVDRLLATPDERIKKFRSKLAALKRADRFIKYGESFGFSRKLSALLEDLESAVDDPCIGIELVAEFFRTDKSIFERCDDSSGSIGDVYCFDAGDLFVSFGSKCDDKQKIAELILELIAVNNYCVRDILVHKAAEVLPEPMVRSLIAHFQALAEEKNSAPFDRSDHLAYVESLARQIGDLHLFEQTRITTRDTLTVPDVLEIGKAHLDVGDLEAALKWISRIPESSTFHSHERDGLLFNIYGDLGDTERQAEVAWRQFRAHRDERSLARLLSIIGESERESVVAGAVATIVAEPTYDYTGLNFMLYTGQSALAESYVYDRREQISGGWYHGLKPLAERLEECGCRLAATIVYRALLEDILNNTNSKAYNHGARYLKKLDALASEISDWRDLMPHVYYFEELRSLHARKRAFWPKYERK